ncbi:MAG TPA: amidohydrolase family protein [Acidimicrobiales bacterium]|nr:amidohydrolase family protein [Acidimicrobiales bacterium]
MAIISVDGHVKASRTIYRQYFENRYLDTFDYWVRSQEAADVPDAGNLQPQLNVESQWDSQLRLRDLESQGVVAEVLFPNGLPFGDRRFEDAGFSHDHDLDRQARLAYNRWLADFCGETPGRRAGQALVAFDDVEQAVGDIHWAKEHGLGGIMMPALEPGGTFFFDPVLDPVWAACVDVDLPISQHGGTGAPAYHPPGFAALMTLATEHSFFSGRSLWQMILGGVFDRFPDLRLVFVETEADWIAPAIEKIDRRLGWGDDWMGFSTHIGRLRQFKKFAREYWASNCYAGISPFTATQVPMEHLADGSGAPNSGAFHIGADNAMFGVDYPHFESIFPETKGHVAEMIADPSINDEVAAKILYGNAARVYNFDLDALMPDIERVGFDLSEIDGGVHTVTSTFR